MIFLIVWLLQFKLFRKWKQTSFFFLLNFIVWLQLLAYYTDSHLFSLYTCRWVFKSKVEIDVASSLAALLHCFFVRSDLETCVSWKKHVPEQQCCLGRSLLSRKHTFNIIAYKLSSRQIICFPSLFAFFLYITLKALWQPRCTNHISYEVYYVSEVERTTNISWVSSWVSFFGYIPSF